MFWERFSIECLMQIEISFDERTRSCLRQKDKSKFFFERHSVGSGLLITAVLSLLPLTVNIHTTTFTIAITTATVATASFTSPLIISGRSVFQ